MGARVPVGRFDGEKLWTVRLGLFRAIKPIGSLRDRVQREPGSASCSSTTPSSDEALGAKNVLIPILGCGLMNAARPASRALYPARTETISHQGKAICMIVRAEPMPEETTFYTPYHFNLQVGKIVYPAGGEILRHTHRPVIRQVAGTPEVLVVQKGRMILDIYAEDRAFLCAREMGLGDVAVLLGGGHGFRLLEDTVLLEVKQGPYVGLQEKELF